MKIAIFTDTFFPNIDGVVTVTVDIAKSLAREGHKVFIVAPKYGRKESFFYPNVKVLRIKSMPVPFYPEYKFANFLDVSVLNFFKKEKIDLVHSHSPFSIGLLGLMTAKYLEIPIVGTFHTFLGNPEYLKHLKINPEITQYLSWSIQRFYYDRCDLITCPSESTKEELLEQNFKKPIRVIPNGVNPKMFDNRKWKKIKDKYNKDGKILLFIGRLAHEKNICYLLDCFSKVVKKMPKTKLLIVGGGPQMHEIKNKINLLKLENQVILTGKIDHAKLIKSSIFKACDVFVTASKTETQGISMLEAQSNSLPCVAVKASGTKDLIKNNHNGFLVKDKDKLEFANKVIEILSNEKLRERMKKNAVHGAAKYSLSNIMRTWKKEYGRLRKHD